ncbi:MAG: xanthine dehydrogenase family protein molybdopterin-binding subunit [Gemmatimonadaceae bacterium]
MPNKPHKRFVSTVVEVEGRDERKIVETPAFEVPPWTADAALEIVGSRALRVDATAKVTGRAVYTSDVALPGMLHAILVRAPIGPARLERLDIAAARAVPGVVDVLTVDDLPRPIRFDGVPVFDRDIKYAGHPIAAVCAESRESAAAGAAALNAHIVAMPPVLDPVAAAACDPPRVWPERQLYGGAAEIEERGDVTRGLREAEVLIRREYRTQSALHTAIEPHGAVAQYDGERLTVWESTQGIFRVRDEIARALGMPRSAVRVLMDYMGGGFGAKNHAGAHTLAAALFAKRTGSPVRCVLDRVAEQIDTGHRPATVQRVTLGARRDGRLTAIVADTWVALGAGGWDGGPAQIYHQMYSCPNVRTTERFVYTHSQPMAAFRGPGHTEGAFGLERAMDTLARELAIDPLELRLRNFAARDERKDRDYSSNGLRRCYAEAAERFGWTTRTQRRDGRGSLVRGFGLASQVWPAGGGPPAHATITIQSDGSVEVLTGTQDLGTGARTILAQIAAESLGVRLSDVRVVLGDTERTPYAGNSWGSMTTASVGPAVRMAAIDARARILEAAAELLQCDADSLETRDGKIFTQDGTCAFTVPDLTKRLGNVMIMGHGTRGPNESGIGIMSFGAQFAEVEVDRETGHVRVLRIVAAHDVGRVINPTLAESQLEGGILQGMGYGLYEERVLDGASGLPLNPTTHDYKIPTIADCPDIDARCIESVDARANHVGARGLAEPPVIPTAPAIANAVADALGVDLTELPLTPWRVVAAIERSRPAPS